uniref:Uncharacterized protein n=2 Tax=Meloidogyne TaxID=189290 RepID=A0A6V7XLB3_MELEN|nr:unnamed protein product [Meloidogyne enterolobii]
MMIGFYSIYKFGLYYVLVRMRHPNKSERYLSFNPLTIYSRKKNERKSPSKNRADSSTIDKIPFYPQISTNRSQFFLHLL